MNQWEIFYFDQLNYQLLHTPINENGMQFYKFNEQHVSKVKI